MTVTWRKTVGWYGSGVEYAFPIFIDAIARELLRCRMYFRNTTDLSFVPKKRSWKNFGGSGKISRSTLPDIQHVDGFSLTHLRALQKPQISLLFPTECCSTTKSMKIRSSFRARQLWRWKGSGTLRLFTRELLIFSTFNKIRKLEFILLQTY